MARDLLERSPAPPAVTKAQPVDLFAEKATVRQPKQAGVLDQYAGGFMRGLGFDAGLSEYSPGIVERWTAGTGRGARDIIETGVQGLDYLTERLGVAPEGNRENTRRFIESGRKKYDERYGDSLLATGGRIAGQLATGTPVLRGAGLVASGASRVAPALAKPVAYLGGSGGTLGSRMAGGAMQGGGISALTSSVSDDPAEYIATGAAFGGAIPGVASLARGAGRMIIGAGGQKITPEAAKLAQRADDMGIKLNVAQLSGDPRLRVIDSTTRKIPLSGAKKELAAQQAAYNRAVAKTFGEDVDSITPDVYARAKARIGGEFERLSAKNSIPVKYVENGDVSTFLKDVERYATSDTQRAINSALEELTSKIQGGVIPGKAYQAMDSKLSAMMKTPSEKAHYVGILRDMLRNAMDDAISPADKEAWKLARQQYRNLKTIRDLVNKDAADGNINPALLMGRVTATGSGKEAVASGRGGDMGELATIGQRFLKDTVPNSGTPERLAVLGGLGAAEVISPGAGLMMIASSNAARRLMNSGPARRAIINRALSSNRPPLKISARIPSGVAMDGRNAVALALTQAFGNTK